eukprot:gene1658-biopygen13351
MAECPNGRVPQWRSAQLAECQNGSAPAAKCANGKVPKRQTDKWQNARTAESLGGCRPRPDAIRTVAVPAGSSRPPVHRQVHVLLTACYPAAAGQPGQSTSCYRPERTNVDLPIPPDRI